MGNSIEKLAKSDEQYKEVQRQVKDGAPIMEACKKVGILHGAYYGAKRRAEGAIKKRAGKGTALVTIKPKIQRSVRHEVVPMLQDFNPIEAPSEPLTITITGSPRLVAQFLRGGSQ